MIYLLDTDTLVSMIRGLKTDSGNARTKARRERARRSVQRCRRAQRDGHAVGLSAITLSELEYGARRSDDYGAEMRAVRKIVLPFTWYDYDAVRCSHHYGALRHELEAAGQPVGSMDMLIAAHALSLNATLVTANESHFSRIRGLRRANWSR